MKQDIKHLHPASSIKDTNNPRSSITKGAHTAPLSRSNTHMSNPQRFRIVWGTPESCSVELISSMIVSIVGADKCISVNRSCKHLDQHTAWWFTIVSDHVTICDIEKGWLSKSAWPLLKSLKDRPRDDPASAKGEVVTTPTSYIWGVRYHVRAEEIHATLASLLATTGTDISSLLVEKHSRRSHGRLVWWFSVSGTGALVDLLDGSWSTLGFNSSWILIKSLNEKQNPRRRAEKRASATPSSSRARNSAPGGWDPAHRFNGHPRPRPPSGSQHGHTLPQMWPRSSTLGFLF